MEIPPEKLEETKKEMPTGAPAYDFAPETYLKPENKTEVFDVGARYEAMIFDVLKEKILSQYMSGAEIDELARSMVAEYEQPILERAEMQEMAIVEQTGTENQKEQMLDWEGKTSPVSRVIGYIVDYLSKHKGLAIPILTSQLVGCLYATQQIAYTTERVVNTGLYGAQQVASNEMYGNQQAGFQESYRTDSAQYQYDDAIARENDQYRQALAQIQYNEQSYGGQNQNEDQAYQQIPDLSRWAFETTHRMESDKLHSQLQLAANQGDTSTAQQLQLQIEDFGKRFLQDKHDFIVRNTFATNNPSGQRYAQEIRQIESRHWFTMGNIARQYKREIDNTNLQTRNTTARTRMRTEQIKANTQMQQTQEIMQGIFQAINQGMRRH